jgi:hypothetical protein
MKNKLFLFFVLLCLFSSISLKAQQGLLINEVMASNDTTIADNTGDYADWIELYNSTASPVLLDGYYISNDINNPIKFQFSGNLLVPSNGYLILWATNDTPRSHTNLPFKVSASGESLYLTLPDGITLADAVSFGQQKKDISYGRRTDGAAELSFFAKPTPEATNNTSTGYLGILNSPVFSVNAGFYPAPFSLSISSDDSGAQIIYTTNGSTPDSGNLKGSVYRYKNKYQPNPGDLPGPFLYDSFRSVTYSNPLAITDASVNPNRLSLKSTTYDATFTNAPTTLINKATVVRAVAVKEGYISSEATTASYFVTAGGINKYTLPVISLATSEDNLSSYDKGLYNAGVDFDKWRALNPTLVASGGYPANWTREDVEFPASFELFTPKQTTRELQTNVGWTINGNWSRSRHQKSFRIYFRSSYGSPNINYPILPDLSYKNYERLVLSSAGQDVAITHMRDMTIQSSVKHLRFETEHSTPAIAFVNGELWGFLNIRERFDDNYFERVYGIKKEELDLLDNRSTVKDGTDTEILSLRNFFVSNDISIPQNYAAVQTRMDMDNFIDYQITEIYFGNNDWPTNNQTYFRKRVPFTPDAPYGHDGRFRWVVLDLDRGLGAPGSNGAAYNSLAWATGTRTDANPATWGTDMIRKLLTNVNFRNQFITRYADLMNTSFLPVNIGSEINHYRDLMAPHIVEHVQRWRRPFSVNAWTDSVNSLIKYANERPLYAKQHLRQYFSLSGEQQLTVDVSDSAQGFIHVNTIDITPAFPGVPQQAYPWVGLYYSEVPVTLVAKAKQGYQFVRWEGDTASTEDSIVVTLSRAMSFKAIFESTAVPVSEVFHYWHFNNLLAGTQTSVAADSSLPGNAVITYEGTGAGFMDPTGSTEGSTVNVQFGQLSGTALRARNPSATRSLIITAPTTNYKNIVLTYATTRTTKGAEYQRIFYTNDGIVWQLKVDTIVVSSPETNFGLQTIDFSTDASTADNLNFKVRIDFFGNNAVGTSGNDRFDNIAFNGIPLTVVELPAVTISADKTSVCATSTVTFTATATNAGASPVYQWKRDGVNVGDNSSTYIDSNFVNGDNVYCSVVNAVTITSNTIIITVISSPVIVVLTKTSPSSSCTVDGKIVIDGLGGISPYQYGLDNTGYGSANSFTNLVGGTYTAYAKDSRGCIGTFTDVLTKPAPPVITSLTKVAASACANDGRITINRSGGIAPNQYSLNNVDYFTSNVFSNLVAGNYTAYVKDAKGCIATFTDVLTRAPSLVITSLSKTPASACANDGKITINRSGGTSPYQYSLNGVNYFTSNLFTNLASGSYTAYIKDSRGCIATFNDVLNKYPALVITSLTKVSVSACKTNDGSITINRTGGTSPYQYSLNGTNYFTSNVFSNLTAGTYIAYVKDARGCITTFTDALLKTDALVVSSVIRTQPSPCTSNGSLTINRRGGSSPAQYSLNNVNYFISNVFSNLGPGTYTAYIKDAKGCIASMSGVVLTAPPCGIVARPAVKEQIVSSAKLSIKAFPNPSTEQFSVIAESPQNSTVEFIVTDLAGRKLLSTRMAANTVFYIGKQLSSGMYFIQALQGKEKATLKIVKGK